EGNRALDPVSILRVEDRSGNVLYPIVDGEPVEKAVPQEVQVTPPEEAFLISDILSDPNAQCITFGVCGALTIPGRPLAVKTGTSEPYENSNAIGDTWAIGYTPQMVVGSWFGNADNSPMFDISSTNVSWRTVRDFMIEYHKDLPVEPFTRPATVVKASACIPSGLRPDSACARTTPEDYFPERVLTLPEDDWWTSGRSLDPPDDLSPFALDQAREWLRYIGGTFGSTLEPNGGQGNGTLVDQPPADGNVPEPSEGNDGRGRGPLQRRDDPPGQRR
ncbi:MAG: hypothetical protein Q8S13_01155, partial [Dehalococcoidia bacterium]|nr:hypothetical protein [Dehalococcoidia bacterium]